MVLYIAPSAHVTNPRAEAFRKATKLWQILEIALEDLTFVEVDPRYVVYMGVWHQRGNSDMFEDGPDKCAVCLAGSVMARTLEAPFNVRCEPENYATDDELKHKLLALDGLHRGYVGAALKYLTTGACNADDYYETHSGPHGLTRPVPSYRNAREQWWVQMRLLLVDLKAADI